MQRPTLLRIMLASLMASSILIGCDPPIYHNDKTLVEGTAISVNSYEPIANAVVQIGKVQTETDDEGHFSLKVKDPEKFTIQVSKDGFVDYNRPLSGSSTGTNQYDNRHRSRKHHQNRHHGQSTEKKMSVEAFLMPVDVVVEIDPSNPAGNTIADSKGAKVTLPPLSGIGEPLIVEMASFHVSTEDINAAPGDFTAIDSVANETDLVSQGMLSVVFKGKNSGEIYDLQGLGQFEIEIPATGNPNEAPDSIPLWYYDASTGKWMEEGSAQKDGDVYRGTVTHFTVWNTDIAKVVNCSVTGTIEDPNPVAGEIYRIKLIGPGFLRTFSQQDFDFTMIRIPLSTDIRVEVTKVSTGEVWSKEATTPATNGETLDLGVFPDPDYVPNVYGLRVVRDIAQPTVTLSWSEPSHADFTGVEITYTPTGGSPSAPIILPVGTTSQTISGLTYGTLYTFTVRAMYTGDRYASGLNRSLKIYGVSDMLILTLDNFSEVGTINVTVNGTTENIFSGELEIPFGASVTLEAVIDDPYAVFKQWSGDLDPAQILMNPVTFTMDTDKSIELVIEYPY